MRACPVHVLALAVLAALPCLGGCSRQEARERIQPPPARPSLPLFADPGAWSGLVAGDRALEPDVRALLERDTVPVLEPPCVASRWQQIDPPAPLPGLRLYHAPFLFTPATGAIPATEDGGPLLSAPLPNAELLHAGSPLPSIHMGLAAERAHVTAVGAYVLRAADAEPIADGEYRLRYPAQLASVLGPRLPWLRAIAADWEATRVAFAKCSRRALALPADGVLERVLDLPDAPMTIELAAALDDTAFRLRDGELVLEPGAGDGVGVRVALLAEDGARHALGERFLERTDAGRWLDLQADLSSFANQRVRLRVETFASRPGTAPDARDDLAWIAEPRLVRRSPEGTPPPGVVLCVIDTLRRDALGCYGNQRIATPHLDALAREGLRFANARSTSNWTLPAHASLFTSSHVTEHGTNQLRSVLPDALTTLAETLQEEGFATAAFAGGAFVSPRTNLDQGFDLFDTADRAIAPTVERALAWVRARRGPWFLFLHTYEVHSPYDAPPAWRERWVTETPDTLVRPIDDALLLERLANGPPLSARDVRYAHQLYEASVAYADEVFGSFRSALEAEGLWDDALVVVTSDHGEEFFEHGSFSHRTALYEEQVAIPLLLKLPRGEGAGTTRDEPVQLLDVAPTILERLDLPVPFEWSGRSFLVPGTDRAHLIGSVGRGDALRFAICTHPLKWIEGEDEARGQVFDLARDPAEREDRWNPEHERAFRDLLGLLQRRFGSLLQGNLVREFSAEEKRILRALGYMK